MVRQAGPVTDGRGVIQRAHDNVVLSVGLAADLQPLLWGGAQDSVAGHEAILPDEDVSEDLHQRGHMTGPLHRTRIVHPRELSLAAPGLRGAFFLL